MKNLSLTFCLVIATLLGSVGGGFANSVNGSFVCERVFVDGSSQVVFITTTDRGMKLKNLDIDLESQFTEIHRGKVNNFKVFVQLNNTISEEIVVLTATDDKQVFHYNGTGTSDWKITVNDRVSRGVCKKV
jgi:hypothetical protein